jgi:hypothetical protein
MRSRLPLFAEKSTPLQDLLEVLFQEAKGRSKKKATSVPLDGRRRARPSSIQGFPPVTGSRTSINAAHPDPKQRIV